MAMPALKKTLVSCVSVSLTSERLWVALTEPLSLFYKGLCQVHWDRQRLQSDRDRQRERERGREKERRRHRERERNCNKCIWALGECGSLLRSWQCITEMRLVSWRERTSQLQCVYSHRFLARKVGGGLKDPRQMRTGKEEKKRGEKRGGGGASTH